MLQEDYYNRERGFSIKYPVTFKDDLFIMIEKPLIERKTLRTGYKPTGRPRKNKQI
jgi:hypothetical protein